MSTKKKAPVAPKEAVVENAATTKKFKSLKRSDFKDGLVYHVADAQGNINPNASVAKGTLAQQAVAFEDAFLRGGVFASVKAEKPAASPKVAANTAVKKSGASKSKASKK